MYTLKLKNTKIEVSTEPLEIRSIIHSGKEICYQQDGSWKKNWPFLFPIVGRLKDDKFIYKNKEYEMKRHGFFRDIKSWTIEEEKEGLVVFSFKSNGEFFNIYPFEFELRNQIEILDDKVVISYAVKNCDNKDMIFAMGHHPAFLCKKNGVIEFEKEEGFTQKTDENGLVLSKPTYEKQIKKTKVSDLNFDNGAFYFSQDYKSSFVKYNDDEISFTINTEDYPVMLLWSASNDEKFVCFEPWLGVPDESDRNNLDLEKKSKMIKLPKDETYVCEFEMKFEF